ncbi:MAG: hypothetical protein HYY58_04745 [Candidatus Omnitrophica bacterium]|nr:hypothetical protein [Candidatus Omnitrophota bacterium]
MATAKLTVEQFIKSRVRDREALRKASARLDAFRKKYGQPEAGFDSLKILRQLRELR